MIQDRNLCHGGLALGDGPDELMQAGLQAVEHQGIEIPALAAAGVYQGSALPALGDQLGALVILQRDQHGINPAPGSLQDEMGSQKALRIRLPPAQRVLMRMALRMVQAWGGRAVAAAEFALAPGLAHHPDGHKKLHKETAAQPAVDGQRRGRLASPEQDTHQRRTESQRNPHAHLVPEHHAGKQQEQDEITQEELDIQRRALQQIAAKHLLAQFQQLFLRGVGIYLHAQKISIICPPGQGESILLSHGL